MIRVPALRAALAMASTSAMLWSALSASWSVLLTYSDRISNPCFFKSGARRAMSAGEVASGSNPSRPLLATSARESSSAALKSRFSRP